VGINKRRLPVSCKNSSPEITRTPAVAAALRRQLQKQFGENYPNPGGPAKEGIWTAVAKTVLEKFREPRRWYFFISLACWWPVYVLVLELSSRRFRYFGGWPPPSPAGPVRHPWDLISNSPDYHPLDILRHRDAAQPAPNLRSIYTRCYDRAIDARTIG
jgi:hypothetical protein